MSFGSSPSPDSQSKQRPEISAIDVQTSCEGMVIPVVYGQCRIAGNMIWMGQIIPELIGDLHEVEPPYDSWCWDEDLQAWSPFCPVTTPCFDELGNLIECPPIV